MKLLIIYHCGLSEDARSIFREYVRQGIDLNVIVPSKISIDKTNNVFNSFNYNSKEYSERGCHFISVDLRKPNSYGEGFKFFQLFRAIKKAEPDIIHVFDEYSSFYLAQTVFFRNILYGSKVPVLAYAAQNIPFKSPPFIFKFSPRFFKRIVRKILHPLIFSYHKKYLSGLTGTNKQALENVKTLGVDFPMRLVYLGIDFDIFRPKERNLCREKIGVAKRIKLIGYFGRIVEEKGLDTFIEAISRMDDYYLMIVGNGSYEDKLNKKIDFLGVRSRIYQYGNVKHDELVDYYNCLDVFVLPTLITSTCQEQYGRVLVEAMACGLPVIGSKSGAIPEVLEGYPRHLIFEPGNADDLINKIKKIDKLKNPENFDMAKFLYKFNVENFAKEHIKFYKTLLI